MTVFRRHFTSPHPLFRATKTSSGAPWRQSVYYLWWEFLRRNEDYRLTCKSKGKGKYSELYRDFGDVHATDFKTWWTVGERGARLFAEPAVPMTVSALSGADLQTLASGWDEKSLIVISVPLTFRKRFLEKRIRELLKKHHTRKRGQRLLKESGALYPLTSNFNFHALKSALEVYDCKRANPKAKLWEVKQALNLGRTLTAAELAEPRGVRSSSVAAKKNTMAVAVSRKLKQAKAIIRNAGRGKFPGPH